MKILRFTKCISQCEVRGSPPPGEINGLCGSFFNWPELYREDYHLYEYLNVIHLRKEP